MEEKTSVDMFCSTIQSLFEFYDVLKCCICLDVLTNPMTLKCEHTFCTDCLKNSHVNTCPLCRKTSNRRDKSPNEAAEKLSAFIKSITEQIQRSTQIDIFSDTNAMQIIKQHNQKLPKKIIKPSTSKPCTFLQKTIPKSPTNKETKSQEPRNVFDVLLESSRNQEWAKKPVRTYINKRKRKEVERVEMMDVIQQFQNDEHKENVVKWLTDSQNEFDRITQTQQGPINQNFMDIRLSSVSQDISKDGLLYYHELNEVKRRRAELRRYGSFGKRCRSLDIQIVKPVRGRLKRQSISCDSPDFENIGFSKVGTEETVQEVEKRVELIQQIEEECLKTLEGNMNKPESNVKRTGDDSQDCSPIPASAWDRMKKLNKSIRKSKRLPKQLKIYRSSSLKKLGKQNVNSVKIADNDLKLSFGNNPTNNSNNNNFENEDSTNNLNDYSIYENNAQKFSKSSVYNPVTIKSSKTASINHQIETINDNPSVNLSQIESFFKTHVCQQSNTDSEYSLNFPDKNKKRKIAKRDVSLEKQLSKVVEVSLNKAEVKGVVGEEIDSSSKRRDLEELETLKNRTAQEISEKDKVCLRRSTRKLSSNKNPPFSNKPNFDEGVKVSKETPVIHMNKKTCIENNLKAGDHNSKQIINLADEVTSNISKTKDMEPIMRPESAEKKVASKKTSPALINEKATELKYNLKKTSLNFSIPNDASAQRNLNEQIDNPELIKCQETQKSSKQRQQILKNNTIVESDAATELQKSNSSLKPQIPKKITIAKRDTASELKSNFSQIENIETEQLVKQISASVDTLLRENPQILTDLVENNTFANLLQKELKRKLENFQNVNFRCKTKARSVHEINYSREVNEKSTYNLEDRNNQDTNSKLIDITQGYEQRSGSNLLQKHKQRITNKDALPKEVKLSDNDCGDRSVKQVTNLCEGNDDLLFSMPTQKMQTEEVSEIQRNIQKIQDVLTNTSFSSHASGLQSIREKINNVQSYLDDLEYMQIDGEGEKNSITVEEQSRLVMNDVILIDKKILKNCERILEVLKSNKDVLKDIEENLKDEVNPILQENNKRINTNHEQILKNIEDILRVIEKSFAGDLKQMNNYVHSSYLKDSRQLLTNDQSILKSNIEILKEIPENEELPRLFNKLSNNNTEILKNLDNLEGSVDDNEHQVKIVEIPMNDIDILKNALRILSDEEENNELEKGIVNITELIVMKHKETLKNNQVHVSLQIDPPQLVSKNIQTDTEKKPLMKSTAIQFEVKSMEQEVQTLVVQNKEKAVQTECELTDSSVQTDLEDRGFHISSNEAFKTLVMVDAYAQTADQNATDFVLSASFDHLQFETQDAVNDLNKQNSEKSVTQILNGLQCLTQAGTSKAIQGNASSTPLNPNNKDSTNFVKSTPQVSHWKLVNNQSSLEINDANKSMNQKISPCKSMKTKLNSKPTSSSKSIKQVENKCFPTSKPFDAMQNKNIFINSKPAFRKSFDSNLNASSRTENINKDIFNKSFNSILNVNNVKKDVSRKLLNSTTRKSLNFNNKSSSTLKEVRLKSAIPLDIEVISNTKASSGQSNLVISLDNHSSVANKEKYKRIRTPSPDSDSDAEGPKKFKKMVNRFIRDDISVVFDSETQNKNLEEDVSSLGSSGINMEYIDRISKKIDNGVFGNSNDAENREQTEERPLKKFKSGPSKKIGTQELLEKCDEHIKNVHSTSQQTPVKSRNPDRKVTKKPEINTSSAGISTKSDNIPRESLTAGKLEKSKDRPETLIEPQEIYSNPCSVEKLIDDALLDDLNKPFISSNKESEDLFRSCLETEIHRNPNVALPYESEADKVMADFIASSIDDKDLELFKSDSESTKRGNGITILQNVVLENPEMEDDLTIIPDSDDEMFENEPDFIENTPERPSSIHNQHLALNSRTELFPVIIEEETIPPPTEFQDFYQVNDDDDLLAQINGDEIKENIPEEFNESKVLPITQNFTNSALLSLSPITKEFTNKSLHLNPLQISSKKTSSTPKSQKQVSIKSFMCKAKSSRQAAAELFGVSDKVKKPCIACSRLNKDQVIAISALTNKKLATYSTVFNSAVTHMIVTTNGSNRVKDHTIKYVNAVAAGVWVLSFKWIQDSLIKNMLLPEEPYEVLDVSGVPGPREARLFCKTRQLLKGFKIHAAPPFLSTTQADIENIIITLGGKIVSKPDELLPKGGEICLIITETRSTQDFGQYETWLEALGVVTVDIEWLSHSVGQFKLISVRRFILCSDDSIANLGYPSELTANVPYSFSESTFN